jgi:glycerophosphoryl diester phosphodiesterase
MHPLLDPNLRPVIAHRGNSAHAPENTLEAFRQGVALGVDALELDVRTTVDGQVVVIHDPTVDRTTDRSGAVGGFTLAEIQRLDAGARFSRDAGRSTPWAGRDIRIPTLDDVLGAFAETPLLIEIKSPDAAAATRELIQRHGATERCIVASFDHRAVIPFRGSGIKVGSSRRDVARLLLPAQLGLAIRAPGFDVMCIPRYFRGVPLPIAGFAKVLGAAGVLVHIWTVDDRATARLLWHAGVRGIISNDPAIILEERKRFFEA